MNNRFMYKLLCLSACLLCSFFTHVQAQNCPILFTNNNPDTFYVDGQTCSLPIAWQAPTVVLPPGSLCILINTSLLSVSGGFSQGSEVPAGTTVFITYRTNLINPLGGSTDVNFTFTITVADTLVPTFTLPFTELPQDVTVNCLNDIPAAPDLMVTDNCGALPVTFISGDVPTTCAGGSFVRTWTATDPSGNTVMHSQTVTVLTDDTPPVITGVPQNMVSTCATAATDYMTWLATQRALFDATDVCGIAALTDDAPDPATIENYCGTIQVQFTATDNCNLSTTVVATFDVPDDVTAPTIDTPAQDFLFDCSSGSPISDFNQWLATHGGAQASDNCGTVRWTTNPVNPEFPTACTGPASSVSVEFIASDACGQSTSTTAIFSIQDVLPPVLVMPAKDTLFQCNGRVNSSNFSDWIAANAGAVIQDACVTNEEIEVSYSLNGNLISLEDLTTVFNAALTDNICQDNIVVGEQVYDNITATLRIQFSFADPCGNTIASTATFAIQDTVPPQISRFPRDTTVQCNTNIDLALQDWLDRHAGINAADECSAVIYTTSPDIEGIRAALAAAPDCGNTGFVTVDFFVADVCGNQFANALSATFTVQDTDAPTFEPLAQNDTLSCAPNAGDNDAALQAWLANFGGAIPTDYCGTAAWTGYTWTAVDQNGETTIGDQTVPPVAPDAVCRWEVTVAFAAADECNNSGTTTATFIVGDVEAPTFTTLPADVTVSCTEIPPAGTVTFEDNCSDQTIAGSLTFREETVPNDDCTYTLRRIWSVTDDCGNVGDTVQLITVTDTEPPTITNIDNVTVTCDFDLDLLPTPVTNDNCNAASVQLTASQVSTQNTDPTTCEFYNYTITRTWRATDACGNAKDSVQIITVADETAPTLAAPADVTIECALVDSLNQTGRPTLLFENCNVKDTTYVDSLDVNSTCATGRRLIRTWRITDRCDNVGTAVQIITVTDEVAPILTRPADGVTLACNTATDINAAFQTWLTTFGGATATDNCSGLQWFAAIPNSYDLADGTTFPGITPDLAIHGSSCPTPTLGVSQTIRVDFVAYDACFQAVRTSATFMVTDEEPPVIVQCPTDTIIQGSGNLCSGSYTLLPPIFTEGCGSSVGMQNLADIKPIVSTVPGDSETPVEAIVMAFSPAPTSPIVATGNVGLNLIINNFDGEEPTEFFTIVAEDGTILGQTAPAAAQCAATTVTTITGITPAQINTWSADGTIQIRLVPNVPDNLPGRFAINDICTNARVVGSLSYDTQTSPNAIYQYSINGGVRVTVNPITAVTENLANGTNVINYYIVDCAGNEATCSYNVTVEDNTPPTIVCPANINESLPSGECGGVAVTLPLPVSITDNCSFPSTYSQTQPTTQAAQQITYTYNPNILEYIADNKTFTFTNVTPNAVNDVVLSVYIQADVDSIGEYFTLIGENNITLGTTEIGQGHVIAGGCTQALVATFTIPMTTYNQWASDGQLMISAVSNLNLPVPPTYVGEGINPCDPTAVSFNGDTDGSTIYATIMYGQAMPRYFATGATTLPDAALTTPPTHTFNTGMTTVHYYVQDAEGNADTCTFTVTVIDQQPPTAVCAPQTIFVNPSGVVSYTLDGQLLDGGSSDNCGIISWAANPNVFTCNQAGFVYNVTLQVSDAAGNTAACVTPVRVENALPEPAYSIGLCGSGDTLRLAANPPTAPGNVYTYQWTGPNGFMSNQPNPVIPNATSQNAGSYTVNVTGITGCQSGGTVEVVISNQPTTPNISTQGATCVGNPITLTTPAVNGSNVEYRWYSGTAPNGTLVATTSTPQYVINNLSAGTYPYYVIVQANGCPSNPSATLNIAVTPVPSGTTTNAAVISVCEGQSITLGAAEGGLGYMYQWVGPDGFSSASQFPPVIAATPAKAGIYTLIVTRNGCSSVATQTQVNVTPAPAQPILAPDLPVCFGDTLVLNANIPDGTLYTWRRQNFTTLQTVVPQLRIFPITPQDIGNWSVQVQVGTCNSPLSVPVNVQPQQPPNVTTSPTQSVCGNNPLTLSATVINGATYTWRSPNGSLYFGSNPTISAPVLAGDYIVTVTSANNCTATAVTNVVVTPPPSVVTISTSTTGCVTGVDNVQLVPTVFPPSTGNYTYQWTGPNGFVSTDSIAIIPNATAQNSGPYILTVSNGANCVSTPFTVTTAFVNAPPPPTLPVSATGNTICTGQTISLSTSGIGGNNVTYLWTTPTGTITTTNPSLIINSAALLNDGQYSVQVVANGCTSLPSAILVLDIIDAQQPSVIINNPVCEGDTIRLQTSPTYPGASYQWTGPNGFSSTLANPTIPNASFLNEGIYRVSVTAGNCVLPTANTDSLKVRLRPVQPLVGGTTTACIGGQNQSVTLSVLGNHFAGTTYTWYEGTQPITPPLTDTTYNLNIAGYTPGVHIFYVIARNSNGCPSLASGNWNVTINSAPNQAAFAGNDQTTCDDNVQLNAATVGSGQSTWSSLTSGVEFVNSNQANTIALNLQPGTNTLVWSLSVAGCGVYSADTVQVLSVPGAEATNDTVNIEFAGTASTAVLTNDALPSGYNYILSIENAPTQGTATIVNNTEISFAANPTYKGIDSLTYKICAENCPNNCAYAKLILSIGTALGCTPPSIITPNGDGINDAFIVPCLETGKYPNNQLVIFNQWGDEVYRAKPYGNNWQGTYRAQDLPIGTYFYVVDFGDAGVQPKSGFLIIER